LDHAVLDDLIPGLLDSEQRSLHRRHGSGALADQAWLPRPGLSQASPVVRRWQPLFPRRSCQRDRDPQDKMNSLIMENLPDCDYQYYTRNDNSVKSPTPSAIQPEN
jgi:hypothetical protein